jgi:hypothetical protein
MWVLMRDFVTYCLEISIDVLRKPREYIKIINALAHNLATDEKWVSSFCELLMNGSQMCVTPF